MTLLMSAATLLTFPVKQELKYSISVVAIRSTPSQFAFCFKITVQLNIKLSVDTLNPNSKLNGLNLYFQKKNVWWSYLSDILGENKLEKHNFKNWKTEWLLAVGWGLRKLNICKDSQHFDRRLRSNQFQTPTQKLNILSHGCSLLSFSF